MLFAPSICFERVSYILVLTEYHSNVACNGQEVKSVCCGILWCFLIVRNSTSFLSFFAWQLSVVFAIIGMLHGFLCRKGLSNAPHKNYSKLHCSAALTLSHIEYL